MATQDLDFYIDKLIEYVHPVESDTPSWREKQKEYLSVFRGLAGVLLEPHLKVWFEENRDSGSDFSALQYEKKFKYLYKSARTNHDPISEIRSKLKYDAHPTPQYSSKDTYLVNIWSTIQRDLSDIDSTNVCLDVPLHATLVEQFPDYTTPPFSRILSYLASTFNIPLILGTDHFQTGMYLMSELYRKTTRLSDRCLISPSDLDGEMCPNGFWEDFPKYCPDNMQRELIRRDKLEIGIPRLGYFGLYGTDDPTQYHPEFIRLLRHYVFNNKVIILLDKSLKILNNSGLLSLLKNSITMDLDEGAN